MYHFYKKNYDKDGKIAFKGKKNQQIIDKYKNDSFFKLQYPKSLDREYFKKYLNLLKKIQSGGCNMYCINDDSRRNFIRNKNIKYKF